MQSLTRTLKILGSTVNLRLIVHLYLCSKNECNVQNIADALSLNQSRVSKHFMTLREAGIVETIKDKKEVFYKLSEDFKNEYQDLLDVIVKKECCLKEYYCTCVPWEELKKTTHDCDHEHDHEIQKQ
ncbi:helix-turn-helix transcriptional regulator [Mycoplasma sp. Ms02]|uniref:ArsR/SmtB family transcription factor n=1 Tax=Mycoplasma sp. Ms02 TaxID=353851 RepID=UPI001C8A53D0|nr:metalloregulator ArsR/SmtB family transcription factor [Mycoplasma sp. Ms02]QZE12319.1 ArsR family transcriptional regulator [Mycoplasma sp. Ms02]